MKTTKWMLAALTTVALVGCDPFTEAPGGTPAVTDAGYTDTSQGACNIGGCTPFQGTGSGSTWTVPGIPSYCGNTTAGESEAVGFVWVKFNKLLDGGSIQTSPNNCTPATAMGLTVTPAAPAEFSWYVCYNPQAPAPAESASIVLFMGPCSVAGPNCTVPAPAPGGWLALASIPASGDAVTVVHATGTVADKGGATTTFDVTADVNPDPGVPGTPAFANIVANTSVDVSWTAAGCAVAGTTRYVVERAPDVAGAPGTYVTRTTTTALTYTDAVTTGTWWYRVTAESSAPANVLGTPSTAASVVIP